MKVLQAILHGEACPPHYNENDFEFDFSSGDSEKSCDEPGKPSIYSGVALGGVGWEWENS